MSKKVRPAQRIGSLENDRMDYEVETENERTEHEEKTENEKM